jgi:hypothetical protein
MVVWPDLLLNQTQTPFILPLYLRVICIDLDGNEHANSGEDFQKFSVNFHSFDIIFP